MYLISKEEMSAKLTKSWTFLSGENLTFSECESYTYEANRRNLTVVLPVTFNKESKTRAMAIGLIVDEAEVQRVASHMFGLSVEELTEDDIIDACKESCNVLGGGLILDKDNKLGIPREISAENFTQLQKSSNFNVTFMSDAPNEKSIILTVLDASDNEIWSTI